MRGHIGRGDLAELLVAEEAVKHLVLLRHRLDEARAVGVPVDLEERRAVRARTVGQRREHRIVAVQDRLLKGVLPFGEALHRRWAGTASAVSTSCATRRRRSTSGISSANGGILSSRSMIVDTAPKRFSAWT